jgi:hypothetical protein
LQEWDSPLILLQEHRQILNYNKIGAQHAHPNSLKNFLKTTHPFSKVPGAILAIKTKIISNGGCHI